MTPEAMYTPEERERRKALIQFNNECQRPKCRRVAWSLTEEARMQLRPKLHDPSQKQLVCGQCCEKEDAAKEKPKLLSKRAERKQRAERRMRKRGRVA